MRRKITIPMLLIATGVCILIGCIPIPGNFKQPDGRPRPEASIGKLNSDKPLKVGASSQAEVARVLGMPALSSADGTLLVYSYQVNDITTFWPICFFLTEPSYHERHLLLRFGPEGRLQSFKTYKDMSQLRQDTSWTPLDRVAPAAPLRQKS